MSPRPSPTRHDATARRFLNAGAELIDAMLSDLIDDQLPPRLRSLHYPAPLDWIRVDDVLRITGAGDTATHRKAFRNRWPNKDEFIRDCLSYTLLYRDRSGASLAHGAALRDLLTSKPGCVDTVGEVAALIMTELTSDPRSLLLAHIAPVLNRYSDVTEGTRAAIQLDQSAWAQAYVDFLEGTGKRLRPNWTFDSFTAALQAITDGLVLRTKLRGIGASSDLAWEPASLYADTVISLLAGAIDLDDSGLSAKEWLRQALTPQAAASNLDTTLVSAVPDRASTTAALESVRTVGLANP